MKKLILLILGIFILAISCENENNKEICDECDGLTSKEMIMWVDSQYGPCDSTDTSHPHCLMVQFAEEYEQGEWEPFQEEICGFDFTPGIRYKLQIKRKKIGEVDGEPQYKYCLIKILKTEDTYL